MTIHLADRANQLKSSASITAKKIVSNFVVTRRHIVGLVIEEPDFVGIPEHIREAIGDRKAYCTLTPDTIAFCHAFASKNENGIKNNIDSSPASTGPKQLSFDELTAIVQENQLLRSTSSIPNSREAETAADVQRKLTVDHRWNDHIRLWVI